jgi:hypothetical protein
MELEVLANNVPYLKDGKRYICRLELVSVKGGKNVLWVAENGKVMKKEPYHRYKDRVLRKEKRAVMKSTAKES